MKPIYIVDDDPAIRDSIKSVLSQESYSVEAFDSPEAFCAAAQKNTPAVAILDIVFKNKGPDGEDLLRIAGERFPDVQCIMISGESDFQKAISCLRLGALDFLEKPVSLPRLISAVRNAMDLHNIKSSARDRYRILGAGAVTRGIVEKIKKLAVLSENVLIRGESGTGKELIARNLHLFSSRYSLPMMCVNCTALNPNLLESELFGHCAGSFTGADKNKKGIFETASHSTLFIDEIGDFPLGLQSKILRVLQEKTITPIGGTQEVPVQARLVFATHRNLEEMVREGTFRQDLYFRISTFTIDVPPLRERIDDIDDLAPFFLRQFCLDNALPLKTLHPGASAKLKGYHYPGNIRELVKILKNAAFFSDTTDIMPPSIDFSVKSTDVTIWDQTGAMPLLPSKQAFERELIVRRMRMMNNNVKDAAESLGIIKNNLYRKLREHHIEF
jgi:two-component system nitrogen regulation response regulator NtrX